MAQQATVKRAVSGVNKGGRPAGSRNAPKVKSFDYEAPKRDFQKPVDFYAYLEGYPDKTALLLSVYRLRPKIDHSLIGIDQSAILQTANPADVTEEAIGETFGRGKYMLKLNDSNKPRGQQLRCRTWIELSDVEKPPQYDPRTLCLGEAQNQDEIMRLLNAGVLVRDPHGAPRLRGEGDPLPVASVPVSSSQNGHQSNNDLFGRDVVGQIVLAALNRGTQSPHDAVKDTIEVARMLVPPAPPLDVEQVVERVVARLRGAGAGAGSAGADAGGDFISQFDRWDSFIGRVRGTASAVAGAVVDGAPVAASGEPGASWAPHLPGILSQARALIPEVIGAFQMLRSQNANGAPPQKQNGAPHQVMTIEQRIEELARLGFERMNEGVSGFDFAAYVCNFHPGGLEVYRMLEGGGAAGLLGLAAMNPATRPLVNDAKTRPQLEAFLSDFFTFDPSAGLVSDASAGASAPSPS